MPPKLPSVLSFVFYSFSCHNLNLYRDHNRDGTLHLIRDHNLDHNRDDTLDLWRDHNLDHNRDDTLDLWRDHNLDHNRDDTLDLWRDHTLGHMAGGEFQDDRYIGDMRV